MKYTIAIILGIVFIIISKLMYLKVNKRPRLIGLMMERFILALCVDIAGIALLIAGIMRI